MTTNMGYLTPVGWFEALPGDTIQHRIQSLIRVSPLVAPVMHPVTVRFHTFFVPNRLIWNTKIGDSGDFEDFITGGPDGNDAQTVPTVTSTGVQGDVLDYLGVPKVSGINVSALPLRAYNLIKNEYYRDQDLETPRDLEETVIAGCSWEKDYFTTARNTPQKGPDITLPLGEKADVYTDANVSEKPSVWATTPGAYRNLDANDTILKIANEAGDLDKRLYADLSGATAVGVNDVRKAFAIQRYQEARSRYGSRYTEYLQYLGIRPSDARLQRPEYLGGSKQIISFSEVLQTESSQPGAPLGQMGGHGIAAVRSNRYRRFVEEHGIVITLMSVRPKTIYTQGIHRSFLRQDKEDFYQRELQQIGQQEIYRQEVYADMDDNTRTTWGYQDRYADYKTIPSNVHGEFRSTLNYWHMGREFTSAPALNFNFVNCDATKRIHAEQTQDSLWCMVNHSIQARRMVRKSPSSRIL